VDALANDPGGDLIEVAHQGCIELLEFGPKGFIEKARGMRAITVVDRWRE
jgi:hypothetical protein